MKQKGISKHVTFLELFGKTGIDLNITGVSIGDQKTEYFNHLTHPKMKILTAIRISIAIPILFKSVCYNGKIYADGGTLESIPLEKCVENESTFILSVKQLYLTGNVYSSLVTLLQNQTKTKQITIYFDPVDFNVKNTLLTVINAYKETQFFLKKKIL